MKLNNYSLHTKIKLLIGLFLLIISAGIFFTIKNLSPTFMYQEISSLITVCVIWGLTVLIIYRLFVNFLHRPVKKIEEALNRISAGDLSSAVDIKSGDEFGHISQSVNLLIKNQSDLADFLEKIGDANFNIEYPVLSDKDKLGHSITGMRDKLQKLVSEDSSRQWSTEGIAKFSTILRENTDDLKLLCDKLLSDLVKYLNANQGAIFLLNDDENRHLELTSAYAWDRKKFITKQIEIGEGLVGQAALEKGTIYLTDVPDNYINITSGLGDANPKCILIVPLLFNDELFGVIEFASFKLYQPFEISFVEKLAEIIASTISRANITKQTQTLLKDSQKLTEELRKQEEEMRKNLEEMNATQEEMQQREVERIGIFTAINNTLATVEFNMEGRIITANDKFLNMMNYSLDEIENKTDRIFS